MIVDMTPVSRLAKADVHVMLRGENDKCTNMSILVPD